MQANAMESSSSICHVVAVPYPGRGHVNPMMNLCKLLCSKTPGILITFVVTEEWLGFIASDNKPLNVRFRTIPNVIPSELVRAKDFPAFVAAVLTKMEAPFEELLQRLEVELPVTAIIADTYMSWTVQVGQRRNIPVASFWTMSASVLSIFHHFSLLVENHHFPADLPEQGNVLVDYIPGLTPTRLADLPTFFHGNGRRVLNFALHCISSMPKARYLLFTSVYELESQVIDAFKETLHFPVYAVGPSIPYLDLKQHSSTTTSLNDHDYLKWLDLQPKGSVLYVSMGSFLSVSAAQMDEIVAGVQDSGVRYLWVSRGDSSLFKDSCGDQGLVIPWCDQLRVLCHSSVGGFWTHCGWNSTLEAVYAGVPTLTFPIFWDQIPNSKNIVEDWKIGWRVKNKVGEGEHLVSREEIAALVLKFMDFESNEQMEMRERAGKFRETCGIAISEGGSSDISVDAFIKDISKRHAH